MRTMAEPLRLVRLEGDNFDSVLRELRPASPIDPDVLARVKRILREVALKGDRALLEYTRRFDGVSLTPEELRVSREEVQEAYGEVSESELGALRASRERMEALDRETLRRAEGWSWLRDGIRVDAVLHPLDSVGCYVPGGRAAYPSTLLMTAGPAKTAGVGRVVVCSPPSRGKKLNPLLLVASDLCGVDEVYRVGGAQAVAALAYGTETIRPVAKIVGPGNLYVAAAKLAVLDRVAIDLPAGPSEVLILADDSADARLIARDLICQAEHGGESVCGVVTDSEDLARRILRLLPGMLKRVERREIVSQALSTRGFVVICRDQDQAVTFANAFAPEHLEVMAGDAPSLAKRIRTAGLILVGGYSPAAATDYCVGTNHVLPTGGFGRMYSGLSILDYVRRCHIVESSREGLESIAPFVKLLAEREGLPNHAVAVQERFGNGD